MVCELPSCLLLRLPNTFRRYASTLACLLPYAAAAGNRHPFLPSSYRHVDNFVDALRCAALKLHGGPSVKHSLASRFLRHFVGWTCCRCSHTTTARTYMPDHAVAGLQMAVDNLARRARAFDLPTVFLPGDASVEQNIRVLHSRRTRRDTPHALHTPHTQHIPTHHTTTHTHGAAIDNTYNTVTRERLLFRTLGQDC